MGLVLDCADPEKLATFWAEALGYDVVGSAGSYVLLKPREPGEPDLLLQGVPETKSAKNRMHFDVHVHDVDGEAERLVKLGAKRLSPQAFEEHGSRWYLLADPEGNEFCVCTAGQT